MEARALGEDPDTDLALLRAGSARDLRARHARRFQEAPARPAGGRHRQSARLRIDRHRRRHLGARPFAALAQRPADRGRDPDRRRAEPGQFRRAAGVLARRGDRHQHRGDHGRAGHLFRGRQQHRAIRAERIDPARPRAARLHRRVGADRGGAAPARAQRRYRQRLGRHDHGAGAERAGGARRADEPRHHRARRRRGGDRRRRPDPAAQRRAYRAQARHRRAAARNAADFDVTPPERPATRAA